MSDTNDVKSFMKMMRKKRMNSDKQSDSIIDYNYAGEQKKFGNRAL